jgi:hypothetical protein
VASRRKVVSRSAPADVDRCPRGCTGHVAIPDRSIRACEPLLFLRWDLVEHVAKNLPRTVCLFLPDKQVLAAEMDLLAVPRHVTFEHRGRNRDVTHHVEAVPIERQRERYKVRVGDKFL